jgi:hypothetical protein
MAQPVWVLSVDLQTKTATFQTGLADAAKAARGSFTDIKGGAGEMGGSVNYSMMEARHSVMLLGEEFGVHLPRALTSFIASIGPIGAAMEAAFPFLAIAVGATLLLEHLAKMRAEGEKLTDDQVAFGTAVTNAFNTLDNKLIQAQIKTADLRNNHMAALKLQLELIDHQSMNDLVRSFTEVAKSADVVMKELTGHFYTFGIGSDGANHALQQFKTQYENLLSLGKKDEASGLLAGTLKQAKDVQNLMRDVKEAHAGPSTTDNVEKYNKAMDALKQYGVAKVTLTGNEVAAQNQIVEALQKQVEIEGKVGALKKADQGNAKLQTGNEEAAKRAAAARQGIETQLRMGEQVVAADKATADASLTVHNASLEERLATDTVFAGRDRDLKMSANQQEIAALDKSGKDYQNQLKALNDKSLEITNEYNTKIQELTAKTSVETYHRDLQALEQGEREKIEATRSGSTARIAAIDTAIKEEQSKNLQGTNFFRELLKERVQAIRSATEEEGKLGAEAAQEDASHMEKTGMLSLAAAKQYLEMENSARRVSMEERIQQETNLANSEYIIKTVALQKELNGLDQSGKDYNNKLKQLQDQEKQLRQQHVNDIAQIREKSEIETNQRVLSSLEQFTNRENQSLTQSIMGHQTWSKMLLSLGDQMVSGAVQNSLALVEASLIGKESKAAEAARSAYTLGVEQGGPMGMLLGAVYGAIAFTTVSGFANGTDSVPGVGRGDVVPAMLSPGEGVVPGGVMDGLRNMARSGGFEQGQHITVHVRPTYNVNTIDGDGMGKALAKHSDQLQRHFEGVLRKMNK